jgi:hypothetical protein
MSWSRALTTEQAITSAVQKYIAEQNSGASNRDDPIKFDYDVLATLVSRIEVQRTQLIMSLKPTDRSTESVTLSIPWQKPPLLATPAAGRSDLPFQQASEGRIVLR